MTEQELRDKIVEIIANNTKEPLFINGKSVSCYDIFAMQEAKIKAIADAIIAAGLTFDGEWKHNVGDILSKVVDVLLQNFKPIWTGAYTTCNARQLAEALFNEGLLSLSLNSFPSVAELTKKVRQLEEENAKYAGQILEAIKILQSSDGFKAQTAIHTAISILLGGKDKNLKKEVDYND